MNRLICGMVAVVLAVGSGCRTQNYGVAPDGETERRTVVARCIQTGITVDGDLADWAEQTPIVMEDKEHGVGDWQDSNDLSARAYVAWDSTHLYFACDVTDDVLHSPDLGSGIWAGDAIQIALDPRHDRSKGRTPDDYELTIALTTRGPAAWFAATPQPAQRGHETSVQLEVVKKPDGTGYFYEMAITWKQLAPLVPLAMADCGFCYVVSDNDGQAFEGGLQWTAGIWYGKRPDKYGRLVFQPSTPLGDSTDIFIGVADSVFRSNDTATADIAVNSATDLGDVEVRVRLLDEAGQVVARNHAEQNVAKGVTRLSAACPSKAMLTGPHSFEAGVYRANQLMKEKTFDCYFLGNELERVQARLERNIARVRDRGKAEENPLLVLRSLDSYLVTTSVVEQLKTAATREGVESALRCADKIDASVRILLDDKLPAGATDSLLVRLTSNPSEESALSSRLKSMSESATFYRAGIPVAVVRHNQYPDPESLAEELDARLTSDRKQGFQIEERKLGRFTGYAARKGGALRYIDLVDNRDLYLVGALDEEVAWMLVDEVVEPGTANRVDLAALYADRDYNKKVDLRDARRIMGFDCSNAVVVVGSDAGAGEFELADLLASACGVTVTVGDTSGDQGSLIVMGTKETSPFIARCLADGTVKYSNVDQGLVSCSDVDGRNVIFVTGRTEQSVLDAGRVLLGLLKYARGHVMLVGDLHMHTTFSDGITPPLPTVMATIRSYMDFASVTDHNTIKGSVAAIQALKERGITYPLVHGQEVTTLWAHLIAIGCTNTISIKGTPAEVIERIHSNNGLVIVAHAGGPESEWMDNALKDWIPSGADVFEARDMATQAYWDWKELERLPPMVSSSDSHSGTFSWPVRTIVFSEGDKPEQIVAAVRNGLCLGHVVDTFYGPDILVDAFTALLEEGEYLKTEHRQRLIERVNSFGDGMP